MPHSTAFQSAKNLASAIRRGKITSRELLDLYQVDRTGVRQLRELLRRSRLHIMDLEKKKRDLDAHINEFKEVETQVSAVLRQRGVDR